MASEIEVGKPIYHVLYADEERLDSLYAQKFQRLKMKEIIKTHSSTSGEVSGKCEIPPVVTGSGAFALEKGGEREEESILADSRYFYLLEELGIDLESPIPLDKVEPDGTIVVTRGPVSLCGTEGYASMVPLAKAFMNYFKVNKPIRRKDEDVCSFKKRQTDHNETVAGFGVTLHAMNYLEEAIIPLAAMLDANNGKKIYMPLKKESMRMLLPQIAEIFGTKLPYKWTVVGYVYPYNKSRFDNITDDNITDKDLDFNDPDIWAITDKMSQIIRAFCSPKNVELAIIPLLILQ